jgi:hypothetical protein
MSKKILKLSTEGWLIPRLEGLNEKVKFVNKALYEERGYALHKLLECTNLESISNGQMRVGLQRILQRMECF